MALQKTTRYLLIALVIVTNIGCDQISKTMVRKKIEYGQEIPVIDQHITLTRVENKGAFLSLGSELPGAFHTFAMLILPLLILGAGTVFVFTRKNISGLFVTGAAFLLGGGIGNLYDRFAFGSVTDFLHLQAGGLQTGVFNMADVSIMIGTGLVLISSFRRP